MMVSLLGPVITPSRRDLELTSSKSIPIARQEALDNRYLDACTYMLEMLKTWTELYTKGEVRNNIGLLERHTK
jgi:hypothetical protein